MLELKTPRRRTQTDEAEKPFWISFSDLMTALMVLFLVAMAVALLAVNQQVQKKISGPEEQKVKIASCMRDVTAMTKRDFPGAEVIDKSINFGTQARFDTNKHLLDTQSEEVLRDYVGKVLELARADKCSSVFKRVIVEGFASKRGTYMHNLNLSLQRGQRVLCVLLDPAVTRPLNEEDRKFVRNLFLVGGSSFNSLKETDADSQRVELKLDFLEFEEAPEFRSDEPLDEDFKCPLDGPASSKVIPRESGVVPAPQTVAPSDQI